MPLNASSPLHLHLLQSSALIALCVISAPFCTLFAIFSSIVSRYIDTQTRQIQERRASYSFRSRTVLVTGVGMSKGLTIARSFYLSGHRVIGADFEHYGIPVCARLSKSLSKLYRLPNYTSAETYTQRILEIVKVEKVDLWISCSGIHSAIEDAEAAERLERETNCKVVQFDVETTKVLHEKDLFLESTRKIGLSVPDTHSVTSTEDAMKVLRLVDPSTNKMRYIMKSVGIEDSIRTDMRLLPLQSKASTSDYISSLRPSAKRPFVLQEFMGGQEYCTHALLVRGRVRTFTACPSSDLLMHYQALSPDSELFMGMLKYTERYAQNMGENTTGHFSLDFFADEVEIGEKKVLKLRPIECNPRAHTAVVLFGDQREEMVEAYLSVLDGSDSEKPVIAKPLSLGNYWIAHDLATRCIIPFLELLVFRTNSSAVLSKLKEFREHLTYWKDGTYEVWDPWPTWWLYFGYWPLWLLVRISIGRWWSRCNVSTSRFYECY
ncbi:hypothetical protein HYALB_00010231 [Hymenoscyphus albidus]|uniref:ATP-grasp domain-containing protein n=1 Tax=Hymenoscyphus albidus TaxID=595503 RepID=A0A9N9LTQ9_9HELO|nr:hypothetical protein HYALB_00010231 [Hymenoscyphus albidus]